MRMRTLTRLAIDAAASLALAAIYVASPHAHAAGVRCVDISTPKSAVDARHGRWTLVTTDQWEFLRGIYVLNPNTPPGLPFGDRAVLAEIDGDKGGVVYFIDGARACTPMTIPDVLIKMIKDVGGGRDVPHEGTEN